MDWNSSIATLLAHLLLTCAPFCQDVSALPLDVIDDLHDRYSELVLETRSESFANSPESQHDTVSKINHLLKDAKSQQRRRLDDALDQGFARS